MGIILWRFAADLDMIDVGWLLFRFRVCEEIYGLWGKIDIECEYKYKNKKTDPEEVITHKSGDGCIDDFTDSFHSDGERSFGSEGPRCREPLHTVRVGHPNCSGVTVGTEPRMRSHTVLITVSASKLSATVF